MTAVTSRDLCDATGVTRLLILLSFFLGLIVTPSLRIETATLTAGGFSLRVSLLDGFEDGDDLFGGEPSSGQLAGDGGAA